MSWYNFAYPWPPLASMTTPHKLCTSTTIIFKYNFYVWADGVPFCGVPRIRTRWSTAGRRCPADSRHTDTNHCSSTTLSPESWSSRSSQCAPAMGASRIGDHRRRWAMPSPFWRWAATPWACEAYCAGSSVTRTRTDDGGGCGCRCRHCRMLTCRRTRHHRNRGRCDRKRGLRGRNRGLRDHNHHRRGRRRLTRCRSRRHSFRSSSCRCHRRGACPSGRATRTRSGTGCWTPVDFFAAPPTTTTSLSSISLLLLLFAGLTLTASSSSSPSSPSSPTSTGHAWLLCSPARNTAFLNYYNIFVQL